MAVETKTEVTSGAPVVDSPGADAFDLEMPEGLTAEEFERAIQPPAEEPKPEAKKDEVVAPVAITPTPAPVVAAPVVAAPAPVKGSTGKALAAERTKTKDLRVENKRLRDLWADIEAQKAKGMQNMRGAPPAIQVTVEKHKSDAIVKTAQETEARGESATVEVTKAMLTEIHRVQQQALQNLADQLDSRAIQRQERELAEDLFEETGENLTEILTKTGMYDAIKRDEAGIYADPVLASKIYGSANPAKAALKLARAKIASQQPAETETETEVETEVVVAAKPAKAPAKAPTPDALAAARRDGAREVADVLVETAAKPRGVRVFTSAGEAPKVGRNPEFWDSLNRLMDKNGDSFVAFMDKNPEISQWFDRGRPKS